MVVAAVVEVDTAEVAVGAAEIVEIAEIAGK
jgi:hypothetical protein